MGRGCLLDVRGQKTIEMQGDYEDLVQKEDIVLLYTGFDEKFGLSEYYTDHPLVSDDLAQFLISRSIKILGMDLPSPDKYPFNIHKKLFEQDILIMENLTNLNALQGLEFEVMAFPLKIEAEASLIRAVAKII